MTPSPASIIVSVLPFIFRRVSHPMFPSFVLFAALIACSKATTGLGGPCSSSKNHLDPSTHKFISQCSDTTYCALPEYGTCIPRLCRRDEFPFGYAEGIDIIPPLCGTGTFCADEGDGCRPLSTFGQACQLNRDEQCASSLGSNGEIESSGVCINLGCMWVRSRLHLFFRLTCSGTRMEPSAHHVSRKALPTSAEPQVASNSHTPSFGTIVSLNSTATLSI